MTRNIRIGTMNVENLFVRFDFRGFSDERAARYLPPVVRFMGQFGDGDLSRFGDFKRLLETAAIAQYDDHRQHTSLCMLETDADLMCLQEVDDMIALERFLEFYAEKAGAGPFPQRILQKGNDMRGIDVAAVGKYFLGLYAKSHAGLTEADLISDGGRLKRRDLVARFPAALEKTRHSGGRIFRRDCLELEVEKAGWDQRITVMNCHFKSMGGSSPNKIGMRQLEACAVRALLEQKFENTSEALWLVTGDLNSYKGRIAYSTKWEETVQPDAADGDAERDEDGVSGIDPLIEDGFGIDLMTRLPLAERWTHYYAGARHKTQLDHMIASPALAARMVGLPLVVRKGMPYRVPGTETLARYPRVGWDRPKASDHCPVVVEFAPTPQTPS